MSGAVIEADVLVVGAGLAGLHLATRLGEAGHRVTLVDRRTRLDGAVRTTGIFVRKTLDDYAFPEGTLGPGIRRVLLYPPDLRRPVELVSDRDEFRVGNMGPLYLAAADAARRAGVQVLLGTHYQRRDGQGRSILSGPDSPLRVAARFVVGADGARSRVARDLGLDRNTHLLAGAEEVFDVTENGQPPTFHCVLDPRLAPGYLAWAVHDGVHAHVGVAGYADRFPGGLGSTLARFCDSAPGMGGVDRPRSVERRAGPIPVGGLLRRIAGPPGLLVGDAAGAVSPLTAGGLDPCLRLSDHAAEVLDEALVTGRSDALAHYDGAALRRRFRGRLGMRHALAQVRTPALAQAGFLALRTPVGRAAARSILFGDRSFPEPAATTASGSRRTQAAGRQAAGQEAAPTPRRSAAGAPAARRAAVSRPA